MINRPFLIFELLNKWFTLGNCSAIAIIKRYGSYNYGYS